VRGQAGVDAIPVGAGTLTSDRTLVFSDDFVPAGRVEIDLRNRSYVRFDASPTGPIRQARVTIGFRDGAVETATACADFRDDEPVRSIAPIEREGARFTAFDYRGDPVGAER